MDKSAFSIGSLADDSDEKKYWLERTPAERLEAVEQARQILYGYDPSTIRLQRILEIAELNQVEYLMVGGYAVGYRGIHARQGTLCPIPLRISNCTRPRRHLPMKFASAREIFPSN